MAQQRRRAIRPVGQRYKPAETVEETILPAEFRNDPYLHVHYPASWEWDAKGKRMIPTLASIVQRPGVNGVGDDLSMHRAVGGAIQKGGTVIRTDDPRLGPWSGFMDRYKARGEAGQDDGYCYDFRDVKYDVLPGGRAVASPAAESFREFRIYLLDNGIVPPIPAPVFNDARAMAENRLARMERNPLRAKEAEAQRQTIADMDAWWEQELIADAEEDAPESATEEPAAKPKPARRRIGGETAPALETGPVP